MTLKGSCGATLSNSSSERGVNGSFFLRPSTGKAYVMWTFFPGWKRRFGGVTLILACVLMVGWLRSEVSEDWIRLNSRRVRANFHVNSANGRINILRWTPHEAGPFVSWGVRSASKDRNPLTNRGIKKPYDLWHEFHVKNRFDWAGFHFGSGKHLSWHGEKGIKIWFIPYWSIVFPLTFLSAFLLLSKPGCFSTKVVSENSTSGETARSRNHRVGGF